MLEKSIDFLLPDISEKESALAILFLVLGTTSQGVMRTLSENSCEVLVCYYGDISILIFGLIFLISFLPAVIGGVLGNLLNLNGFYTIGLVLSFLYVFYLSKLSIFAANKLRNALRNYLDIESSNKESDEDFMDLYERYALPSLILFSSILTTNAFLHYPEVGIELNFSNYLFLVTVNTAIVPYLKEVYGESLGDEYVKSIKKISFWILLIIVLGAIMAVMPQLSIQDTTLISKAIYSAFRVLVVVNSLVGFLIMMYPVLLDK